MYCVTSNAKAGKKGFIDTKDFIRTFKNEEDFCHSQLL